MLKYPDTERDPKLVPKAAGTNPGLESVVK